MADKDTKGGEQEDKTTVVTEGDPLPPVEITIDDDEKATTVETKDDGKAEEQEAKPKKKDGRFQRRIDQVTARATQAETTAERLFRENEELKQTLAKTSGERDTADRAAFNNHASNVDARLNQAKRDLIQATNDGDAAKIADATAEVSKWGAEQGKVENWKRTHPEPTAEELKARQTETKQPPQQQQRQEVRLSEETRAFIERNRWFEPSTRDKPNADFDPDMHVVARRFAGKLEKKMEAEGTGDEIGTPEYYAAIEAHMQKVFPDYDWEDGDGEPEPETKRGGLPKMNGDQRQISQRSSSNGGGTQQQQNNKITLSGEQRSMAHSLADQGAYGPTNPATGKPWTHGEAEVRYARKVAEDQKIQRQRNGG
jgi:hypothetical protein